MASRTRGTDPLELAEKWCAARHRANPPPCEFGPADTQGFLEWAMDAGVDPAEHGDEVWSAVALELGIPEDDHGDFLEQVASYISTRVRAS